MGRQDQSDKTDPETTHATAPNQGWVALLFSLLPRKTEQMAKAELLEPPFAVPVMQSGICKRPKYQLTGLHAK